MSVSIDDEMSWMSVPPAATFITCTPRQIPSVGRPRSPSSWATSEPMPMSGLIMRSKDYTNAARSKRVLPCMKKLALVILFVATAAMADDAAIVAALDTKYQAAVKANDVTEMDRILADDFILVTGRGKSYTKADLLASARGREVFYEHQEDANQTVHVWGDTAVITALLWIKG